MIGKGATPSFFAIANDNYTLTKKESCFAGFTTCGGSRERHLHIRRSAIPRRVFYLIGNFGKISYQIKKLPTTRTSGDGELL